MSQKIWLGRTLNRVSQQIVDNEFQRSGRALPCRVVKVVSSNVVTVNFEVNSSFTLPQVTVPMAGSQYIRYPIQVGDGGYVAPADVRLAGISGIGSGVADLSQPANLTALVFVPFANAKWPFQPDPNAVVIYGPNGTVLRDTGNASNITLTPSGIAITTPEITANAPTITVNASTGITTTTPTYTLNGNLIVNGMITAEALDIT